jgi:quercetin dioxygenase-like cupin family protein
LTIVNSEWVDHGVLAKGDKSVAESFHFVPDLTKLIAKIPQDSIVSRTVYQGEALRIILFGFAAGQELSEHTSAKEAVLEFLRGEAVVTLGSASAGGETVAARPGTLIRMAPGLPHTVRATKETLMLLTTIGA